MAQDAKVETLKFVLQNWVDADVAAYRLACILGILPPDDATLDRFNESKHMFWSADPLGETIGRFLQSLTDLGIVEFDPQRLAYRWKRSTNPCGALPVEREP